MGESCDEGGPCPSHKIPQERELERNVQNNILFIHQYVMLQKDSNSFPSASLSRSLSLPSNVDVSSF